MNHIFTKVACTLFLACAFFATRAQSNAAVTGTVTALAGGQPVPSASVIVRGTAFGAYTNDKGAFHISAKLSFPVTLVVSSVGFREKEVIVPSATVSLIITLEAYSSLAGEVVVSASRLPERIVESPVTVDRLNTAALRNAPATSYYDVVATLKGVDVITSGLNFKTPTTRGFNTSGNLRLNQMVDGMDNQAPGLNFPVGTMVGPTDLDVDNMELLGGASSALYGPGGMNGTLLINSKNPFKYQGLSAQVREGAMHIADDARKASAYNDISLRYARQFNNKFAFKLSGQFVYAKDWVGQDYANFNRGTNPANGKIIPGTRTSDPNYQGVNVYGDETSVDITAAATPLLQGVIATRPPAEQQQLQAILAPYLSQSFAVSRTGYREADILDPTTKNLRISGGLYYNITPSIQASLSGNWGSGTTVYTGSDRYNLKDFRIGQYKLELKHNDWFVRAYTTQENAGKSFNATASTQLFNEAWKPSYNPANAAGSWYPQYAGAFIQTATTTFQQAYTAAINTGQNQAQAQAAAQSTMLANTTVFNTLARAYADLGRPEPGTAPFKHVFDSVASRSISSGGGLFVDKSSLYMLEGQYNFTRLVKVVELLAGANFKQYVLNSGGTIFADTAGRIRINEAGAYALVSRKFFHDVLKLTASGRYDKNENFKGRFTPRFSAVVTVAKSHNFRLSYQTAYRFPSTQNQWINLNVGGGVRLIGGLPQLRDYYSFNTNAVYTPESVLAFNASAQSGAPNPALLTRRAFGEYKPESATSYEVGYKTLLGNKLFIDAYAYYTEYKNFLGRVTALQSADGTIAGLANYKIFSVSVNSPEKVNTYGWAVSGEYLLPHNFSVSANVYSDRINNVPPNFVAQFNTPKFRSNVGLSNSGFLHQHRVGFSVQYHHQDHVYYQADFGAREIPAINTIDAQVSYRFTGLKTMLRLGATNLTNRYYTTGFGNPQVGGLYYVSISYNNF